MQSFLDKHAARISGVISCFDRMLFRGAVVSDMTDRGKRRLPGMQVKHRAKMNWIKMYDKVGSVLRVETVINEPDACKVRKRVWREGLQVTEWVPMRKGVANLFRYRDVSLAANAPYLDALANVDDPGTAIRQLRSITGRKRTRRGQSVRAFNPLSEEGQRLFKALLSGDNAFQKRGRIQFTQIGSDPFFENAWRKPRCSALAAKTGTSNSACR